MGAVKLDPLLFMVIVKPPLLVHRVKLDVLIGQFYILGVPDQ